jgi:hypothetical protein
MYFIKLLIDNLLSSIEMNTCIMYPYTHFPSSYLEDPWFEPLGTSHLNILQERPALEEAS